MGIDHLFTGVLGSDAVLPVILISKTSTGPAQKRHLQRLQRRDHIGAHTVFIGNRGILAYKNTLIDAAAKMLGKMTVDLRGDMTQLVALIDLQCNHKDLHFFEIQAQNRAILI